MSIRSAIRADLSRLWPVLLGFGALLPLLLLANHWVEAFVPRFTLMGLSVLGCVGTYAATRRLLGDAEREDQIRAEAKRLRDELDAARAQFEERKDREEARLREWTRQLTDHALELGRAPPKVDLPDDPAELLRLDAEVEEIIHRTSERISEALRDGKYVREDVFDGGLLTEDVGSMIRDIAATYHPGQADAWMKADPTRLAHAAHRALARMLYRLGRLPGAPSQRELGEIVTYYRTFRAGKTMYDRFRWVGTVAPWAYNLARLVAGSNPVTYTLWSLAFEALKRGGTEYSKQAFERSLGELVGQLVMAIGEEAAILYGPGYGRRDKNYVLACEAVELARRADSSRPMLEGAVKLLTDLRLRDELERRGLFEGLVGSSFSPASAEWLPLSARTEVMTDIERLFEDYPPAMSPTEVDRWRSGLEQRLGQRSVIAHAAPTLHDRAQLESAVASVIGWANARGQDLASAFVRVEASALLDTLEPAEVEAFRTSLLAAPPTTPSVPRFDLRPKAQDRYFDALLDVMSGLRPWGPHPDLELLEEIGLRLRRADARKLAERLASGYQTALGRMVGKPAGRFGGAGAYAALLCLRPGEVWMAAEPFQTPDLEGDKDKKRAAKAWVDGIIPKGEKAWLLASEARCIVMRHGPSLEAVEPTQIWEATPSDRTVRVDASGGWFSEPRLRGGRWAQPPPAGVGGLPISKALVERLERWWAAEP